MPPEHSLTYRFALKNLTHLSRLHNINKILNSIVNKDPYCDVGCSNGYLTNIFAEKYGIKNVTGFDNDIENLAIARNFYNRIEFRHIDLNTQYKFESKFKLVTCFETLEHVGDLNNALNNLIELVDSNGILVISVPIEVGLIGLIKFLIKTIVFRYTLNELTIEKKLPHYFKYLLCLLLYKDPTIYRKNQRGFGTHFGFNFEYITIWMNENKINYKLVKKATTAFYIIKL